MEKIVLVGEKFCRWKNSKSENWFEEFKVEKSMPKKLESVKNFNKRWKKMD